MDKLSFKYGNNDIEILMRWFRDISDQSVYIKIEMLSPKKIVIDTIKWRDDKGNSLYNKTATKVVETIALSYIKKNGLE